MVTEIANGVYRVDVNGRTEIVYVAGTPGGLWAWWNGRIYQEISEPQPPSSGVVPVVHGAQPLTAPMPGTVLKVVTRPGDHVQAGDTLVILEAMKMELPVRALDTAVVAEVRCREGQLVQADTELVTFETD